MLICRFQGETIRDPETGRAKRIGCPTCFGEQTTTGLKVFRCNHPGRGGEATALDCESCNLKETMKPERSLILANRLSPGDVLVMTAALESLHRQFPGKFATAVKTTADDLFENNPHVIPLPEIGEAEQIDMQYPLIDQSNQRAYHFMHGYVQFLGQKLGLPLELQTNRPYVYLTEQEKTWIGRVQEIVGKPVPYWLVNAGTKGDYTTKQYPVEHYQRVVDMLQGRILFVQIGAKEHRHKKLRGVIDQVGKTSIRELVRLVYHSQGGLGPSTLLQHLCAAMEKPYICLLGGREPATWVQYPFQTTLHTIGALSCCRKDACWRSRVVALIDGDEKNKSLCDFPVFVDPPAPKCMAMIAPETITAFIDNHLRP
jgi:ADP-heptose:LPS heptosyltransferase